MPYSALPVLAFGFSSPLILSGLALASIPVVIHLLHRRRYVETPWAAMQFLIQATKKQSRRIRLENLILLLVRTLVLILIVLALARPHFDTDTGVIGTEQPVHRILIVDSTFSMQRTGASSFVEGAPVDEISDGEPVTRFAQAKTTAQAMVQNGSRGDAWSLLRIADSSTSSVIGTPAFRTSTVEEEIQSLTVSDSRGNLAATLEAAVQAVKQLPELPRKEVVFISDLQSSMWAPDAPETLARLKSLVNQIGQTASVSLVNVAGAANSNLAVTGLQSDSEIVTVDQTVSFRAIVRNFGQTVLRDQTVELLVDGRLVDTKRLDLPPGIDTPLDWDYQFLSAGDHSVEIHLEDDALPLDNRRWMIVPVREQLSVLLVNGRPAGRPRDTGTFYVERALAPSTTSEPWQGTIRPQVVGESELQSAGLSRYDVVVLCNVGLITNRESTILTSFVQSGGGLIVLPGEATNSASYNTHLFNNGEGILPAEIGELSGSEAEPLTFDPREFAHPVVRAFRGNPGAGLEATLTFQFLKLKPADDAQVAMWFSDGSPALVEKRTGSGRVILAATSADSRWGTWAIWAPSFVPMMHELVLFAASGQARSRQLSVGEPIVLTLPQRLFDLEAHVERPDGSAIGLPLNDSENSITAVYDETDRAGVYQVVFGSPMSRMELYAVNVAEQESDLSVARQADLSNSLFAEVNVSLRGTGDPVSGVFRTRADSGLSILSRILAWTVLSILLLEPLLAWRFSWGILAFAAAATAALMAPMLGWGATAVVGLAGAAGAIWRARSTVDASQRSVAD
jgi:hypothetical protein